jgi:hypothetical protein
MQCTASPYPDRAYIIAITNLNIISHPVFYLKYNISETGFCLRLKVERTQNPLSETPCFKQKTGRWIMSRIVIVMLIYHRHKPIDSINLLSP